MVNLNALKEIRKITTKSPVVFMPTHRTYVDFLLISLLCYDQNIKLPAICAGADFLSSKFVGEALRRCGAFFIRRSFGSVSRISHLNNLV
jgi:glycerone phosphate O-acyltransferase